MFVGVSGKPAVYVYETARHIKLVNTVFQSCTHPIKFEQTHTWDYMGDIVIDAFCKGTAPTIGIEFVQPAGTMEYPHPMAMFDIRLKNCHSIKNWHLLHDSKIKTDAIYNSTDNYTLNTNTFYSDIYLTGWGKYVDLDGAYVKSNQTSPSFSIHTNNSNVIRCTKLPALNANVGNGGITVQNDCSLTLTVHNDNYNNMIVDQLIGVYAPRTV